MLRRDEQTEFLHHVAQQKNATGMSATMVILHV